MHNIFICINYDGESTYCDGVINLILKDIIIKINQWIVSVNDLNALHST